MRQFDKTTLHLCFVTYRFNFLELFFILDLEIIRLKVVSIREVIRLLELLLGLDINCLVLCFVLAERLVSLNVVFLILLFEVLFDL